MSSTIAQNIEALCKEQGIDKELVIAAVKEAVRAAAREQFKANDEIQVEWNPAAGIELFASKWSSMR
ncbi:MAG: NusA N-terminal domain-containing protein [Pyrinomonadaceae bacterium]